MKIALSVNIFDKVIKIIQIDLFETVELDDEESEEDIEAEGKTADRRRDDTGSTRILTGFRPTV